MNIEMMNWEVQKMKVEIIEVKDLKVGDRIVETQNGQVQPNWTAEVTDIYDMEVRRSVVSNKEMDRVHVRLSNFSDDLQEHRGTFTWEHEMYEGHVLVVKQ